MSNYVFIYKIQIAENVVFFETFFSLDKACLITDMNSSKSKKNIILLYQKYF